MDEKDEETRRARAALLAKIAADPQFRLLPPAGKGVVIVVGPPVK
jgi:hypothetical protein